MISSKHHCPDPFPSRERELRSVATPLASCPPGDDIREAVALPFSLRERIKVRGIVPAN